ncbi:NADP-dependent oxidoreductase, partial [Odoribacter sp. OttesenSCG-928-A06]|nr:NADP-dependent oxidoreductase [Odoribacter sp. OttesenSCG-928-A06]
NHFDILAASGALKNNMPLTLPWIPGTDFAGVVTKVGKKVTSLKKGDEVYGLQFGGLYAEYALINPNGVVLKPKNLSFEEAAGVPQVASTAWQGLFTHGKLQEGQTVLIHGAAGGVGAYAVQFAHQKGARVIATAQEKDRAYLEALGAYEVIDYERLKFEDIVKDVDLVFDLVGKDYQQRSFPIIKKGGIFVSVNQPIDEEMLKKYEISGTFMSMQRSTSDLENIAQLLDAGKVKFDLADVYPLKEAATAWKTLLGKTSKKKTHGKIVLKVE